MNAYVKMVINGGQPLAQGGVLYFQKKSPKMGLDKKGKYVQVGVYIQRVKAEDRRR